MAQGGPTTVYRDNGVDGYRVYRRLEDVETHLIAEVIPGAGSSRKLLSSSAWISAVLAMVVPKSSANSLQRQRLDGLRPNTSMHGVEELVEPPYLFGDDITYTLHLGDERREVTCRRHAFAGWVQRYERVADLLSDDGLVTGPVLDARAHLLEAPTMTAPKRRCVRIPSPLWAARLTGH